MFFTLFILHGINWGHCFLIDFSSAQLSGWTVVILSDQWIIRSYSSHEAWKPGPMLVQAVTSSSQSAVSNTTPLQFSITSLPPDQQAAVASLVCYRYLKDNFSCSKVYLFQPEAHRNLVLQICVRTGLNAKFSVECLSENAWDLERAIANFDQVKV
jgi:nuclear RNA export factor